MDNTRITLSNSFSRVLLVLLAMGGSIQAGGPPACDVPNITSEARSGVVDARQPWMPGDPSALQGIGGADEPITIVTGEVGADPACFVLCETAQDLSGPNAIANVVDNGDGTYTLTLARPITANAVTTIA